ncbi:MAG: hypothetical protein P8N31_13385 [Planctomycetota bacterium]|nr:hypothetical protein [Planctomycetota bacterium]MDG2144539.1 hypothetical protein [Planctomycetota bacterium]
MESLDGVERLMMSGRRATLVLEPGAVLTEARLKEAFKAERLVFESMERVEVSPAGAAYIAKTPKFT